MQVPPLPNRSTLSPDSSPYLFPRPVGSISLLVERLAKMPEKTTFSEVDYAGHKDDYASHKEQTYHDEAPARQASVALNVVDNPLRVRILCIPG